MPSIESIFFPIKSFPSGNLASPFHYENRVYPGKFCQVIGNKKAAYKFLEVRDQKFIEKVKDNLADMNARVREMIEMESITGSNILKFNGHFR